MAEVPLFEDLVIYVIAYPDVEYGQTKALEAKLQENGASVRRCFSDKVTHVVVQRTHAPSDAHKAEGDSKLREVFQRIDKVCQAVPVCCSGTAPALRCQIYSRQSSWLGHILMSARPTAGKDQQRINQQLLS
jgi:hypothetical protein